MKTQKAATKRADRPKTLMFDGKEIKIPDEIWDIAAANLVKYDIPFEKTIDRILQFQAEHYKRGKELKDRNFLIESDKWGVVFIPRFYALVKNSYECICKPHQSCPCEEYMKEGTCTCFVFFSFPDAAASKSFQMSGINISIP